MHSTYMFVHTIPAFKLLPGRPRRTFFSSTTFLGGMFLFFLSLLLAKRVCWTVVTVEDRKLHSDRVKAARDARTSAGPAALGARVFSEEKREREVRVRDSLSFATTVTCRWCSGVYVLIQRGEVEELQEGKVLILTQRLGGTLSAIASNDIMAI